MLSIPSYLCPFFYSLNTASGGRIQDTFDAISVVMLCNSSTCIKKTSHQLCECTAPILYSLYHSYLIRLFHSHTSAPWLYLIHMAFGLNLPKILMASAFPTAFLT